MRFRWPLAWPFGHPGLYISNYVDHDPSPEILDYMGGDVTYDGHRGTDLNLGSFRDMDEGVPVVAAANGRVIYVEDGQYDRWTNAPDVPWNVVVLAHEDGTVCYYGHLRTNSAPVVPGEAVHEGQMIGFVGSAGKTLMPHLHFEAFDGSSGSVRDPFRGTQNQVPSLWKNQEDYVGDDHFRLLDVGVTTASAFSDEGGLSDWSAFKERPSQPAVFGEDEPILKAWALVDGQVGDPFSIEIHRPDGSMFARLDAKVPARNYGQRWEYWDVPFSGTVSPAQYGDWYAQVLSGGAPVSTDHFTVGETSAFAPRFHPAGGRSFHLSSERQQDILSLSFLGAPMEDLRFALENAPSNVSLSTDADGQTIVSIDPAGPDLAGVRSREFTVVATDPSGLQDRMHYHLVNSAASTLGSPPAVAAPSAVSASEGDTVVVDVSASDADGDPITELTAYYSSLPSGNAATFATGPGNTTGRLVWPTKVGDEGVRGVTFVARTSFGGAPSFGYPPIVQTGFAGTTITVAAKTLAARAFLTGRDRTLRLFSERRRWCVSVEPLNASFSVAAIDPKSVELGSHGTGSVDRISPVLRKRIVIGDMDRNSVADIAFCFEKEDLRRLFDGVTDRQSVTATIDGKLMSGAGFSATIELVVVGGRHEHNHDEVTVSPNPLNPETVLTLNLSRAGPVRVRIYDTQGRLVRTLLDTSYAPAGSLELRVDAKDGAGRGLGSGVYFFQVSSLDGVTTGRFVVLK